MPGLDGQTVKSQRRTRRLARKVSARDHSRGSPLARTTLVAYGDFASPACAQTYRTVKKIQKKMGTNLRYVYRSFPQPEQYPHSEEAAEAAECASSQGKFWEMHDAMFESGATEKIPRRSTRRGGRPGPLPVPARAARARPLREDPGHPGGSRAQRSRVGAGFLHQLHPARELVRPGDAARGGSGGFAGVRPSSGDEIPTGIRVLDQASRRIGGSQC